MTDLLANAAEYALSAATKAGSSAADTIAITSADVGVGQRLGTPEDIERSESRGLGLRVFVGNRSAAISTSDFSKQSITELAELAVAMAGEAPEDATTGLAPADKLASTIADLDLADLDEPSVDDLFAECAELEDTARAIEGITNSEGAGTGFQQRRMVLRTSHGFSGDYQSTTHSRSVTVLAGEGTGMERDYAYSIARYRDDLKSCADIGNEAAMRTLRRMHAKKPPTGSVPIILDPRVGRSLLGSLAGAINGASIVRGTSFLKDAMHTQILPDHLTITDDPARPKGLGSHPFDGEGVNALPVKLVENGVLKEWLLDSRSAGKLGLETNGRARRGLSGNPSPAPSNLYLTGGVGDATALIKGVKSGLYVTETFGMGVNLVTGDYSQGAAGIWIEDGELAYPVSELTIAGHLTEMFKELDAADDLVFEQAVNTPTLRIAQAMVAAGV